jgi:hypothetical protein
MSKISQCITLIRVNSRSQIRKVMPCLAAPNNKQKDRGDDVNPHRSGTHQMLMSLYHEETGTCILVGWHGHRSTLSAAAEDFGRESVGHMMLEAFF